MVDVAQLVEPRIVIPVVAGSSPVVHPTLGCKAADAASCVRRYAVIATHGSGRSRLAENPAYFAAVLSLDAGSGAPASGSSLAKRRLRLGRGGDSNNTLWLAHI
jgi:hypothetical protein